MKKININSEAIELENINELSKGEQELVQKAKDISHDAYAPYSNFFVGAAVLLEDNQIIVANNQENAAYPSGICAERNAVFFANATNKNIKIKTIAITAFAKNKFLEAPITPCGACRQVLLETENKQKQNIKVILCGTEKIIVINSIKQLLPLSFDSNYL